MLKNDFLDGNTRFRRCNKWMYVKLKSAIQVYNANVT